ncbi:hypothetical protein GCM10027030_24100 [Luteococcus sediminum]|uniref:fluoride efflux transporter CrcB n=1 Tax=Luteococcus sp. TaxID=1969402 RepID=UPI003736D361
MSAFLVLVMALAGGAGAVCRHLVGQWVGARSSLALPLGTWLVNLLGSLVLGALAALTVRQGLDAGWRLVLGTGFCGGFTTFSTAAVETVRLVQQGRPGLALVHLLGGSLACVAAAAAGWLLAA